MKCTLQSNNYNFSYSRLRLIYLLIALLAFFAGTAIYTFFRNHNIVLFHVFPKPSFLNMLYFPVRTDSKIMSMFIFNMPNGLWFLSGLLVIRAVWLTNQKWRTIYFYIFALIALSMEFLQLSRSIPGTFDVLDIVFMALFAFAESVICNMLIKRSVLR